MFDTHAILKRLRSLFSSRPALIAAAWSVLLLLFISQAYSADWYSGGDGRYGNRKHIIFDHTKVSGPSDLTNFPALVATSDAQLRSTANGGGVYNVNGYDILFTASDGTTKLLHQIESYEASTGKCVAWVRIPTLSYSVDTDIYMYFGNPDVSTSQDTFEVWDSNYKAVWHLRENPAGAAPQIKDSTVNIRNGTTEGGMTVNNQVPGKIDGCLTFEGQNDDIKFGNLTAVNSADALTVSAWIKVMNLGKDCEILSKGAHVANDPFLFWYDTSTTIGGRAHTLSGQVGTGGAQTIEYGSANRINDNNWHYVVLTFVGSSAAGLRGYVDGTEDPTYSPAPTVNIPRIQNSTWEVYIGKSTATASPGYYFQGFMDEVRLSVISRSADWIKTEYNNQCTPESFFVVQPVVESLPSVIIIE